MDSGGGWLSDDGGPSPDLEAKWGPDAPVTSPPRVVEASDAEWVPSVLVADVSPRPRGGRRAVALVIGIAALVLATSGAIVFAGDRPDGGDGGQGGGGGEQVAAAASGAGDGGGEGPAADSPAVSESTRAFMERWNAGPSTTMPLGEAGVPPHERPPTTTVPPTTTAPGTGSRYQRGGATVTESVEETEPEWVPPDPEPEEEPAPPTISPGDPRLRDAERVAQEFADAMTRRDCDAVWSMLSSGTIEFIESIDEEGGGSAKDSMCASMTESEIPVITAQPPARPYGRDGAFVTLVAEGEPEPEDLGVVLENDQWMVDLFLGMETE